MVFSRSATLLFALAGLGALLLSPAAAAPAPAFNTTASVPDLMRRSTTALSTAQESAFLPYSYYAGAGYCQPASIKAWDCGVNCAANPSFIPLATGGDGSVTQYWYVGYDTALQEVIVAHQGTLTSAILPLLEDLFIAQSNLDSSIFPGVKSSVKVHSGFKNSHARSAHDVLAAVKSALATYKTTKVVVTGHSLGAALGLLDSMMLVMSLPSASVRFIGYALPGVGNQAWANAVDAQASRLSVTHVNNKKDLIPTLPGLWLGFHQPSGEVHIQNDESWVACSGQDNKNRNCILGAVPTIFSGDLDDHYGPYDGVTMRTEMCN
ncbi:lipase [Epithele typhae]|uniref:lipase n=1 Tax=Epithele typhae TaxID=378194 RepID=UPI002007F1DE|nr:lipase [Epithele typhae]KAH9933627.1 lipase [Epithele typhae]